MSIKIDKIIRSNRKSIGLEITQDAVLIIRAPHLTSLKTIQKIVTEKKDWIRLKQEKIRKKLKESKPKEFITGEKFWYLGREYELIIKNQYSAPFVLKETFQLSTRYQTNASEVITSWYKRKAQQKIGERVRFYYALTGFKYNQIKINSAQTRWGSCSHSGNLNFTWRLIMAPLEVVDYVVVHEMVHLEEKNHAQVFWNKVEKIMPEYKEHQKWLKENGHFLKI